MDSKKIKRFFTVLFLWPVYCLSYLFPRSKKIWVFGSFTNTFADNSKYLFLQQHLQQDASGIVPVWITKSKTQAAEMRGMGYKCYWKQSLKGAFYCLRASAYIYSWTIRDINFWLSGGATCINLWHGIPFKKIGSDNVISKRKKRKNSSRTKPVGAFVNKMLRPTAYVTADLLLSPHSPEVSAIFKRTFPAKRLINALYPRVAHFTMPQKEQEAFINIVSTEEEKSLLNYIKKFDSVWVYMPTFRDNEEDKKNMYAQEVFDFDVINPILQKKGVLLLVKYHYVAMQSIMDKDKYSNVVFINSKMDMYVILPYTSGLITDYSSIFFDYMLLQKPILFYAFDLEAYQKSNRELYYPYDEATCGTKITSFKTLCAWFEHDEHKKAQFDYAPYIQRFWGHTGKPYLLEQLHGIYCKHLPVLGLFHTALQD